MADMQSKRAVSAALATSIVASTVPCRMLRVNVYNDKGSAQYIQIHDANALPAEEAVPIWVEQIATKATLSRDFSLGELEAMGMKMNNGLVVCNSSTAATKTIGSADCWFSIQYI